MKRLVGVSLDEAHCIRDWRWRLAYRCMQLIEFRIAHIPHILCSATSPPPVSKFVQDTLNLDNLEIIKCALARTNIFVTVIPIKRPGYEELQRLLPEGRVYDKSAMQKTLIFVDSIDDAVAVARYLRSILPRSMSRDASTIIRCYFAELAVGDKELYIEDLRTGKTLFLICTEACGMGMDVRDIQAIAQWKLSSKVNLRGIIQRLGRAGRDPNVNATGAIFISESQLHHHELHAHENTDTSPASEEPEVIEAEGLDSPSPGGTPSKSAGARAQEKVPSRFTLAALRESSEDVTDMVRSTWAALEKEEKEPEAKIHRTGWQYLEDALVWFINTTGCRNAQLLAYLDSPDWHDFVHIYFCCDNCIMRQLTEGTILWGDIPAILQPLVKASVHYTSADGNEDDDDPTLEPNDVILAAPVDENQPIINLICKTRREVLEEHLKSWRVKVWRKSPSRCLIRPSRLLKDEAISRIKFHIQKINTIEDLQRILEIKDNGYRFPESGLINHLSELFNEINRSLEETRCMQPRAPSKRPRPPTPEFRPLGDIRQSIAELPWLVTSRNIDLEYLAEGRRRRQESARKADQPKKRRTTGRSRRPLAELDIDKNRNNNI